MKLLALETSQSVCSVSLSVGGQIISEINTEPRAQAKKILAMVSSLLAQSEISFSMLDTIAFGRGPGSFTGLRIAASVAQGLSFAHDIGVVPVSSLCAIAQGVYRRCQHAKVQVLVDARMNEVYYGKFELERGLMQCVGAEQLLKPELFTLEQSDCVVAGSALLAYESLFETCQKKLSEAFPDAVPLAEDIAVLAASMPSLGASEALPVYLRDNVAHQGVSRG